MVVQLRHLPLLPRDDLLAVTREFLNPEVSLSGLGVQSRHLVDRVKDEMIRL